MIFCSGLISAQPRGADLSLSQPQYEEQWDSYFCMVKDHFASIALDMGLRDVTADDRYIHLLTVSVKIKNPNEKGLTTNDESKVLWEIEDALIAKLQAKFPTIHAGRVTVNESRDLYYYVSNPVGYDEVVNSLVDEFPTYTFKYGIRKDENWALYDNFLYPDENQYQNIVNSRVIYQLQQNGDNLEKARKVHHWLYFSTEKNRNDFVKSVSAMSYVEENRNDYPGDRYPYYIQISRTENVDYDSVNDNVFKLKTLAKNFGGDYDGWETSIEK